MINFKRNILLSDFTTFKTGGKANYFTVVSNKGELIKAIKFAKELKLPFFILGKGSNVLFLDSGYEGLVIQMKMDKCKIKNPDIYSDSGVKLISLAKKAVQNSLTGLEWAGGIPGSVGGAIYMNAAAFGSSISDIISEIEVLDIKNFKIKKLSKKDYKSNYKDTIFIHNKNLLIVSAVFQLKKGNKEEIAKKTRDYINYRNTRHPMNFPSAGSVFKNVKLAEVKKETIKKFPEIKQFREFIPAAFLIEACGLKGKKINGAKISEKHANFIVNFNKAKTSDIIKLTEQAKKAVKNKFSIELEEEIRVIK